MDFSRLKAAFLSNFKDLSQRQLYVLDIPSEVLWDTYLGAFDNDPIFKTRREHDCSCCRHFIRDMGALVTLQYGKMRSVWLFNMDEEPGYQKVVNAMAALAERYPIKDIFIAPQASMGVDKNRAEIDGVIHTFNHFYVKVPNKFVADRYDIDTKKGKARTDAEMMAKAVSTITSEAAHEVIGLINSNSIYRGAEFKASIEELILLQNRWTSHGCSAEVFGWENFASHVARIKNTAIGTLLVDLSEGMDIESAVKSFEKKVAPENYKRPTSLVTPKMIEDAKAKVAELGLLDAIHRRYATLADISVNNVLFADRTAKARMKDAFGELAKTTPISSRSFDRVDEIGIEKFLTDVLPDAATLEVLFENSQMGNLVSLVTEAQPDSARLFKWNNPFSWSYNGDVADSIKERVKAAGGNVTGEVCCRLAWNNKDDLDLHMHEPKYHLYYGVRGYPSPNGGHLDVDANGGSGMMENPVENIFYARRSTMKDGTYQLSVHQFRVRDMKDGGFTVEVDINGEVTSFESPINPSQDKTVHVASLVVKNGQVTLTPVMKSTTASRTEWGIATGQFHRVNAVLNSPNHWEGEKGIGNKHTLFVLADCVNAGNARGFYNEFLRGELDPHRKVLELLGSRQRTEETPDQLSGLGFSSTKKQNLIVRVTGPVSRVLKVVF